MTFKEQLISILQEEGYDSITSCEVATQAVREIKADPRNSGKLFLRGSSGTREITWRKVSDNPPATVEDIAHAVNNLMRKGDYFDGVGLINDTINLWTVKSNYKLLNHDAKTAVDHLLSERSGMMSNPPHGSKLIYNKVISIEAQKGKNSLWPKQYFRHDFQKDKTHASVIGLPDGSLLIKSRKGKRLWKNFQYDQNDL